MFMDKIQQTITKSCPLEVPQSLFCKMCNWVLEFCVQTAVDYGTVTLEACDCGDFVQLTTLALVCFRVVVLCTYVVITRRYPGVPFLWVLSQRCPGKVQVHFLKGAQPGFSELERFLQRSLDTAFSQVLIEAPASHPTWQTEIRFYNRTISSSPFPEKECFGLSSYSLTGQSLNPFRAPQLSPQEIP